MSKTKEIVIKSEENQVTGFIQQAIEKGMPVETMEKLFALHEKVKAEKAKGEFVRAMAEFQKEVKTIKKTKKVMGRDGKLRYQYAPIDAIVEQIKEPLAENNLSYSWESSSKDKMMNVICKLTHVLGHQETSSFEIPIGAEFMTAPQQYAAALTFARRYTLCNVLGLSTADEDTDATTVNPEKPAKSDKANMVFLLKQLKEKTDTVGQVEEAVERLTGFKLVEVNYPRIVTRLETTIKEQQQDHENPKV